MLPNRRGFFEELKEKISFNHVKNIKSALVIIDVNSFNRINEAFGFWVGDLVLKQMAKWIKDNISDEDIPGRIGGDQFAIWFNNVSSKKEVLNKINKIFPNGEMEFQIENHKFLITLSIGVVIYPDDGSDLETLFSKAYLSMKEVKKIGKGVLFFSKNIKKDIEYESLKLELELIEAIKNKEFFLEYQPVIDLKNKDVFGAEALIRWNSPKRGLVSPDKFIPVLEEKGMIIEVGYWIMDTICKFLNNHSDLKQNISMNVSVKQLYLGNFAELLHARMKLCEDLLDKLIIEVTESVLMENIEEFLYEINKLKSFGIRYFWIFF
jgi:diguanylate cyclase (GGDEF)-like protein